MFWKSKTEKKFGLSERKIIERERESCKKQIQYHEHHHHIIFDINVDQKFQSSSNISWNMNYRLFQAELFAKHDPPRLKVEPPLICQ